MRECVLHSRNCDGDASKPMRHATERRRKDTKPKSTLSLRIILFTLYFVSTSSKSFNTICPVFFFVRFFHFPNVVHFRSSQRYIGGRAMSVCVSTAMADVSTLCTATYLARIERSFRSDTMDSMATFRCHHFHMQTPQLKP